MTNLGACLFKRKLLFILNYLPSLIIFKPRKIMIGNGLFYIYKGGF